MEIRYSKQAQVVLAWDTDFTKVTDSERQRISQAEQELKAGEYVTHEDVWAFLEQEEEA